MLEINKIYNADYLDVMGETWKEINGYEGLYEISDLGRVKSCTHFTHRKNIILKPLLKPNGYCYVNLYKNHKGKKFYIHRLVAETFLEKIPNKEQVNHKDLDKTNNALKNLEWCSCIENIKHSWKTGAQKQIGEKHHLAKLALENIMEYSCLKCLMLIIQQFIK